MEDFVTIATYTYTHECVILKPLFEKEGITYFFKNETIVGIIPFYSNAIGGIRLMVKKMDVEKAKAIIQSLTNPSPHLKIV